MGESPSTKPLSFTSTSPATTGVPPHHHALSRTPHASLQEDDGCIPPPSSGAQQLQPMPATPGDPRPSIRQPARGVPGSSLASSSPDRLLVSDPSTSSTARAGPDCTNLIVNYIPNSVEEDALRSLFRPFGDIESCKLVRDHETGLSAGYGFVKYKTAAAAQAAMNGLNGYHIENKTLKVSVARPAGNPGQHSNLYIAGLPLSFTRDDLEALFSPFGSIVDSRLLLDAKTGENRGVGFVRFESRSEAERAIRSLHQVTQPGSLAPLTVKFADTAEERKRKNESRMRMAGRVMVMGERGMGGVFPMGFSPPFGFHPGGDRFSRLVAAAQDEGRPLGGQGTALFVYNIPFGVDEAWLHSLFSSYGRVARCTIVRDRQTNAPRRYGFVNMLSQEGAARAIQALNGRVTTEGGKPLQVSFKREKMADVLPIAVTQPAFVSPPQPYALPQAHPFAGAARVEDGVAFTGLPYPLPEVYGPGGLYGAPFQTEPSPLDMTRGPTTFVTSPAMYGDEMAVGEEGAPTLGAPPTSNSVVFP